MKSLLSSIILLMFLSVSNRIDAQCAPDVTPPTCITQDVTIYLDGAGAASVSPAEVDNGSSDACPPFTVSLALDQTDFDCSEIGPNTVTLTVTDAAMNSTSCTATVTVLDTISPVCVSGTALATLFVDIAQEVPGEFVDEGSTDNCGLDATSFSIVPNVFDCDDVGINPVVFTTTDGSGNTCSSMGEVLVVEKIKPTCITKDITVTLDLSGNVSIVPSDVDDGTFDACGVIDFYSVTPNTFDCSNLGMNTVTFVAQDTSDNFCTTTANVFVEQPINCMVNNPTAYFNDLGVAAIQVSDVDNGSSLVCGGALNLSLSEFVFNCQASFSSPTTVYLIHTDGSGLLDSCESMVTLLDTVSPTCEAPFIETLYLDAAGMATASAVDKDVVGSDNCELSTAVLSKTDFTCSDIGVNNETILLTDVYGNTKLCPATITVLDTFAPQCNVMDATIYVDDAGMAVLDSAAVDNGSSDFCGIATLTLSQTDFTCGDLTGTTTVIATVTDLGGNTSTCESIVTVLDTINPVCMVSDITVFVDASGTVVIDGTDVNNGSSDNCTNLILALDETEFDCTEIGANTVVVTVTDGVGNSSSCSAMVEVMDTLAPICLAQDVTIYVDGVGDASIVAADIDGGSSDNCGTVTLTASPVDFDCSNVGVATVSTLTVTDDNGNTSTCDANITVLDTISPICMTQDVTIYLDGAGVVSVAAVDIDNGSSDNCMVQSVSIDIVDFDCDDIGDNTVMLTVLDVNSNSSTCPATVTVLDTINPICNAMDIEVFVDGSGNVTIVADDINNMSSDNCNVASSALSQTTFDCDDIPSAVIALVVADQSGNTSSCMATVTVTDTVAPVCTIQDITVYVESDGDIDVTAAEVDNGSTDNCGAVTLGLAETNFDCDELGVNQVVVTVEDTNGNSTTCMTAVTVLDTISPICNAQDITVNLDAMGIATITAALINDGSTDNCIVAGLAVDQTDFDCSHIGANPVVLTVTDGAGNTSTCSAVVTVQDQMDVICMVQDVTIYIDQSGMATVDSSAVDNGSSDNCGSFTLDIDNTDFNCDDIGMATVTITVTDFLGNTQTCASVITIADTLAPICDVQDLTVYLDGSGMFSIDSAAVDAGSSDNCANFTLDLSQEDFTCADLGANTVTVTTTDDYGNVSTCSSAVMVADTTSPVCVSQDITVFLDAAGEANITVGDIDNGSNDNCGPVGLALDQSSFDCTEVGVVVVTLTVTDASGNTSECDANVAIMDTTSVMCLVQDVTLYLDAAGMVSIDSAAVDNGSSDNCTAFTLELDAAMYDCSQIGVNTVIATVTDASGNSATCSLEATVLDTISPVCNVEDITVYLDAAGMVSIDSMDIDVSSSDNCPNWTLELIPEDFTCMETGVNSVSVTVTDASNNINTCSSLVTVLDTISPVCAAMDITVQLDAMGMTTITANDVDAGSMDNCGDVTLGVEPSSFDCTNVGSNPVVLTVTDDSGNASTCTATVTVEDNIDVICDVQDVTLYLDASGMIAIDSSLVDAGSSDNCGDFTLELDAANFDCDQIGANTVIATVTDSNGNSSTCSLTATVLDTMSPICNVMDISIYLDNTDMITIDSSAIDAGTSDNCPGFTMDLSQETFNCGNVGNNVVTVLVEDSNGNSSMCESNVMVFDTMAPICATQDITIQLSANGTVTITATDIDNGSSDNCSVASLAIDITDFDCTLVGDNTVTLTVTDINDNSSTCTAIVTVEDNMDVICDVQDVTLYLDASGMVSIDSSLVDAGSSDNCGDFTLELDAANFDCDQIGANTVIATVTDANGNSSTCSLTATVLDTMSPICNVMDISIYLDNTDMITIDSSAIDAGTSDNCPGFTMDLSQETFNCGNVGNNVVTVLVEDSNGNTSMCESNVMVFDTMAPICATQDITIQLSAAGTVIITATDIDNGSSDNCDVASLAIDITDFDCTLVGDNTVTFTVTDINDNSSTCTATVTVEDNMDVICDVQDVTLYLDASGMVSIDSSLVDAGSSDNCGDFTLELDAANFDCDQIGANTVIATVTDANGNSSTCSLTATVLDTMSPICNVMDISIYLDNTDMITIDSSAIDAGTSDNCPGFTMDLSQETFNCGNVGNNVVTVLVEDSNGNTSMCESNVMVFDTMAPICATQDITVQLSANGTAMIAAVDIDNGSSDNCDVASLAIDITDFDCTLVGDNTVTLTVTDINDNSSTCTATVTVEDNMDVICDVQDVTLYLDASGMVSIDSSLVDAGSSDNCGDFTLELDAANFDCDQIGANIVIATVTDANGNSSTCSLTATVLDTMSPICNVMDISIYLDNTDMITIDSSAIDAGTSDNCPGFTMDLSQETFNCGNVGNNVVTVLVEDSNGNTSMCESNVMVFDTMAPICATQDITVQLSANGTAMIAAVDIDNGSSDNCDVASLAIDITDFDCTLVGDNTVTLTVTDINDNSSTCTATVTVEDNMDVICDVQDVTLYLDASGMVSIDSSLVDAGSSDNCGDFTLDLDTESFDCTEVGLNTVIATVTDGNGNSSTCSLTAMVLDTISPVCDVIDITLYLDNVAMVSIDSSDIDDGSDDNCPGFMMDLDQMDFDCANLGDNTVTVTTKDASGNSTMCTSSVMILDTMSPICNAMDITVQLDANGMITITPADIDNGSSDNCTTVDLAIDISEFDCALVGDNTVTMIVTDGSGNTSECTSTVTVQDTMNVICMVQDVTLYLDENGMIAIDSTIVDAGSSDNCDAFTLELDTELFDCSNVGMNTVLATVTDANGNVSTCDLTATVLDTMRPICDVVDITVHLDATGMVQIDSSSLDVASSDNCGSLTLVLSDTDFDCGDVGPQLVTVTTTDSNGNVSTCTSEVMVLDTMRPICMVQDITVYLDNSGSVSIDSSDVDNGSSDNCASFNLELTPTSFACENIGQNPVLVTTTDINGNISQCLSIVTVLDTTRAICNVQDVVLYLDENGNTTIDSSDVDNGTLDNCINYTLDLDITDFDCTNVGSNLVTITIEDENGNLTMCTLDAMVLDTMPPLCEVQNVTLYLDQSGMVQLDSSDVDNGSSDNCNSFTLDLDVTDFDCDAIGMNTVIITTTDLAGNISTCESTVTVLDSMRPICLVQDITINLDENGMASIDSSLVDNGSIDNCGALTLTLDKTEFDCTETGVNTVIITTTDAFGNVSTCEAEVTVLDEIDVMCNIEGLEIFLDANGIASIDSSDVDAGSMDNCSDFTLELDITDFDCTNLGDNLVTATATDASGNVSICSAIVVVTDTIKPTCMVEDITVYLDESGEIVITEDSIDNGSFDNCTVISTLIDISAFDCGDIGPNSVNLFLVDQSANSTTCPATVTILDTLAPICLFNNPTLVLDATGNVTIDSTDVDAGSSDNCGAFTITIEPNEFTCADIGINTVSVTLEDAYGNAKTGMISVTVEGIPTPIISCPADVTINCLDDITDLTIYGEATIEASCDGVITIVETPKFELNECGIGTITREFIVTETGSVPGMDTCYQVITIVNNDTLTANLIDFPIDILIYECSADLALTGMVEIMDTDLNCNNITITHLDDTLNNICPIIIERTFTVVDSCNVDSGLPQKFEFTQSITVADTMRPLLICSADIVMDAPSDACEVEVVVMVSATDNCSNVTISNDSPYALANSADATGVYPVGTTTVTFTAIDTCGNTAMCSVDITVEATMPLTCQLGDLYLRFPTSNMNETIVIDSSDLHLSTSSCFDIVSIELSRTEFACGEPDTDITVTVTDGAGATTTCNANVIISSACINFNNEEPNMVSTNAGAVQANVLDAWGSQCASLNYAEGGSGLSQDSTYLNVTVETCGLDAFIFTNEEFTGNLGASNDDVVLCYDLAILGGENTGSDAISTLTLFAGADPTNPTYAAVFVPTGIQMVADGFTQVCAPLATATSGVLPSNASGSWIMTTGSGSAAWDSLILNVSGIAFDLDEIATISEYGLDNICIRNLIQTPPVFTCPEDLEIACSDLDETVFGTVELGESCMMTFYIDTLVDNNLDACNTGEITRTLTVVDELGNSESCVQTITVEAPQMDFLDEVDPIEILLPGDLCNDIVTLPVADINKFACSSVITFVTSINGVDIPGNGGMIDLPAGIYPLIYTAEDECGNESIVETEVRVLRSCDLSVHASLNVSLDQDCTGDITPAMLATFPVVCDDYYTIVLVDENGEIVPDNIVTEEYVGQELQFILSEPNCGNSALGVLNIEDKYPPVITCVNDTINCGDPIVFPMPEIVEGCGIEEIITIDESMESVSCTSDEIETILTRTVVAIDESGNLSDTCVQIISIRKFVIDSVKGPELFSVNIECNSPFPMDDQGNPDPLTYGGPLINGIDLYANPATACNVHTIYDDFVLELPFETAVIRTWTVFYWSCTIDTSVQFIQLFKFIDTNGPDVTCPLDVTVASNADECSADLILPEATVSDLCSEVDRIDLSYLGGYLENGNGAGVNLPLGINPITYIAYDILGNSSSCTFNVVVEDQDVPIAICDQFTVVPIPLEGFVDVKAEVFDDGSFDYCGIDKVEVRRMIPTCDPTDSQFGESIRVCCDDIGVEVQVVMRVTDNNGNTNECMVFVEAQDKIAPQLLVDLPDVTVSCEFPIDEENLQVFGTYVNHVDDRDTIILTGEFIEFSSEPLDGVILENCLTIMSDEISSTELNDCGLGYAIRTVVVADAQGNELTVNQRIDRINVSPFEETDIQWPMDYDAVNTCSSENLNPEDLPEDFNLPVLANTGCDQVGYTYEDSFFDQSQGEEICFKIIRSWEVANWCNLVNGSAERFYHQQTIIVTNTIAPEITADCENLVQCSYDPDCGPSYVELMNDAMDDCTDSTELQWTYYIDLDSDNNIDISGSSNNASGMYPVGLHTIMWSVSDLCGNATACSYTFEIQNCKQPTAYCFDNLTADLTPMDLDSDGEVDTEMLILKPYMLDAGSFQTCNQSVMLSFSEDVNDTIRTYDCDHIGEQLVTLWVTDENGNQSYCGTSIIVQDNNDVDFCDIQTLMSITGTLMDSKEVEMDEVTLLLNDVNGTLTDDDGTYSFVDLPMNEMYTLIPSKEDDPLNGITTLDIVLMQKHLLGLELFTSPYQHLAADVNQSQTVSGADIIHMRRLILGEYEEFPETDPWRFYMNEGEFTDLNNPWANSLHEMFDGYIESNIAIDFTGVKMGDVNNTATVNGLIDGEAVVRSTKKLFLSVKELELNEEVWVDFTLDQAQNIHGYQLELQSNIAVNFLDVVATDAAQNLDFRILNNGKTLRVIDYNASARLTSADKPLFAIKMKALKTIYALDEVIEVNKESRVRNEMYMSDLSIHDLVISTRAEEEEVLTANFTVSQNVPNPWKEKTSLIIDAPNQGEAELRIIDMNGKIIYERKLSIVPGENVVKITNSDIPATGVLYYSVEMDGSSIMKKMLVIE